jgi:signal transduction histidine kinase/ligand-binding sensor domain-containing protein
LVRIRNGEVTRFGTEDGLPDDFVSAIHYSPSGSLWITTRKGICELRGNQFVHMDFQTEGIGPNPEFLGIYEDTKTNVWAFGNTFLVNLRDGRRLNNFRGGDIASYRIWSFCEGRDGSLWISTSGQGLFSFVDGHFVPVVFRDRVLSSDVRTVLEDDEGNIWLGTFGRGLIRMRPQSWELLGQSAGLPMEPASCVAASADGRLYAGFLQGGLFSGNRGRFTAVGNQSGFETENLVTSVYAATNGTIWVSTYGEGVYELTDHGVQQWTTANGLSDNVVLALCADATGAVCIGCRSGELQRIEAGAIAIAGKKHPFPGGAITCLKTSGNSVLVGMENGRVWRDWGSRVEEIPTPVKLQEKPIRALLEDSQGRLWVGADNTGLACVAGNQSHLYEAADGFTDLNVRGLLEDAQHDIWVGTTVGIWLVRDSGLKNMLPESLELQQIFAEATGLPGANLPGGPGAASAADGMLYFASSHGVIKINSRAWFQHKRPLQIHLEQLVLNNVPYSFFATPALNDTAAASIFTLNSTVYSMEFRFTVAELGEPEALHFQHYLEGIDPRWVDNGSDRVVRYGRMPYGKYQFRIRASRGDNNWYEMETPFAFQLEPPLWLSSAAMLFYGLLILGLVMLGVRQISVRRLRRTLARLAQQQAMEKERMRIAQNMHDEIGSKLTRISFLSELVSSGKEPSGENIRSIATTSRKLLQTLDEIVWAVNPQNDTVEYLASYLGHYANEYFQNTNVSLELSIPDKLPDVALSSETRHNLFLAFEEALGNVLKHSGATRVRVEMVLKPRRFSVIIQDNGSGFTPAGGPGNSDPNPPERSKRVGNGLRNIKKRMAEISGEYQIESAPGRGTMVILHLSLLTTTLHE